MAKLFWRLNRFFLNGLEPGSIFPTMMEVLPKDNGDKRADAANEAVRKLMYELHTLQLVKDENRQQGSRRYTVVVSTELGVRVLRTYRVRGGPNFDPGRLNYRFSKYGKSNPLIIVLNGGPTALITF
jgi:hypothetical protein